LTLTVQMSEYPYHFEIVLPADTRSR